MNYFRMRHIDTILSTWKEKGPLDFFLSTYFRKNKSIGSKDRKVIAEAVYDIVKNKGIIDFLFPSTASWKEKIIHWHNVQREALSTRLPLHLQYSTPNFLFKKIMKKFGDTVGKQVCSVLLQKAPLTIRTNLIKISKNALLEKLSCYGVFPTLHSSTGIQFPEKISIMNLPEYKNGFFELQDEGSQIICENLQVCANLQILDYCAGSGGKSLAIASFMQKSGQIYLHDVRKPSLFIARKRMKRAGVQNVQYLWPDKKLAISKRSMDRLLLDVPCSGTGTLRRNPERKWLLTEENIKSLVQEQRNIFAKAFPFVKKSGLILYATCSILVEENEEQTSFFLHHFPIELVCSKQLLPVQNGMDGFYYAVFKIKES